MAGADPPKAFQMVLPKRGMLYIEESPEMVLCKPKILPLKSVTLEKLEKMQKEAQESLKAQEAEFERDETKAAENNPQPAL